MKTDVSIHFSIKGQTPEDLAKKLDAYCSGENLKNPKFDFSERADGAPRNVLHHCFFLDEVTKQGMPIEVYHILDTFSEDSVCWYGTSGLGITWDRRLMLENLKKIGGIAIFLGDINAISVIEEYKIAMEQGIECIMIP